MKNTFLQKRQFLFCPGPVNVSSSVKDAVAHNEIGHREAEFSYLLRAINKKLLHLFGADNGEYHAVVITGSGTAANEAVLSSIVGDDNILVISNGEFGNRLHDISKHHNKNTHFLQFNWGERIDIKKVESYVKKNSIKIIAMVHHETSTGMLNPVEKIGKLAKKYNITLVLDTVSSAGAEIIDLAKWNVGFCTSSASKAIGAMPGVATVVGKKKEFQKLKNIPSKTIYLNLYKFYEFSKNHVQTPNTPAVQLFFGLEQALSNIIEEGMVKRFKKHVEMATFLREGMKKMGLSFFLGSKDMSCVLTTVNIPDYVDIESLKYMLRKKNIIIYNGKGPLLNKAFQVGNIGELTMSDAQFFLELLSEALDALRPTSSVKVKADFLTKRTVGHFVPAAI